MKSHPIKIIEDPTDYIQKSIENIKEYKTGIPNFMEKLFSYELQHDVNPNKSGSFSPIYDNNLLAPQFEILYSNP